MKAIMHWQCHWLILLVVEHRALCVRHVRERWHINLPLQPSAPKYDSNQCFNELEAVKPLRLALGMCVCKGGVCVCVGGRVDTTDDLRSVYVRMRVCGLQEYHFNCICLDLANNAMLHQG